MNQIKRISLSKKDADPYYNGWLNFLPLTHEIWQLRWMWGTGLFQNEIMDGPCLECIMEFGNVEHR